MPRKTQRGVPKKQAGISLVPALWEAIDEAARRAGVRRNQVMETVLMREFGLERDLRKMPETSHETPTAAGVFDG